MVVAIDATQAAKSGDAFYVGNLRDENARPGSLVARRHYPL
jgi:hypothetical protein